MLTPADFAWTGRKSPAQLLKVGDLVQVSDQGTFTAPRARVQLEQQPAPQAALLAIDNATGEIKAMVGGYDFEASKFNRATQASARLAARSKCMSTRRRWSRACRPSIPSWTSRSRIAERRPGLFAAKLRRQIRGPHHAAPRARGFAQRAGGPPARKSWHAERDRRWRGNLGSPARCRRICRSRSARPISR